MTRLQQLFTEQGQSPWLDNLRRGWITSGELENWVAQGVRGLTSNPSIFTNAILGSEDYDDEFSSAIGGGLGIEAAYWKLVTSDILAALEILRPVYDESNGIDGYVSVEVDPKLARDSARTSEAARQLHAQINAPNLYVKIPGTTEGLLPIKTMIAEHRSINVTLIFSLQRYAEVMETYISGLEAAEGDLSDISSVASFFVSRLDTEVDRRLDVIGTPRRGGAQRQGGLGKWQIGLRDVFANIFGPSLGSTRGPRGKSSASVVGIDINEESRLSRHAVCR